MTIRLARAPIPTEPRRWMTHLRSQMRRRERGTRGSPPVATVARQRQLVVMFPLSPSEAVALCEELAPEWSLADYREVRAPDAVLLPPCSGQTTAAVRSTFPHASLIVVDPAIDGPQALGDGPVRRALTAGADLYAFEDRRLRPERPTVTPRPSPSPSGRHRGRRRPRRSRTV